MLWVVVSIMAIFFYVWNHTRSLFISCTSMVQILFSLPITCVIYRNILCITNLSVLHLMVLFVVLGVSADNIFVIWDAWRQSNLLPDLRGNQKRRMAYTFRRTYKALLATSGTTAFAFLSNGFSSLMPVSAFGLFAFILVPINYILIVFYFPAFLIVYENSVRELEAKIFKKLVNCFTCKALRQTNFKAFFLGVFLDQFD